jgi:hypothetical protein
MSKSEREPSSAKKEPSKEPTVRDKIEKHFNDADKASTSDRPDPHPSPSSEPKDKH